MLTYNQIFGIALILICSIGYFLSWRSFQSGKIKYALLLLLICGLLLRIFASCDFYLHTWDERYHALVAKNFLRHPLIPTLYDQPVLSYNYQEWWANHIWVHKQPMPLWLMAGSMKVFGVNEIAVRIPSIIASVLGIFLTFRIGTYLFGEKNGFIAAFLFSINGLIIELAAGGRATDHYDALFLFFIELAIFFAVLYCQKEKAYFNLLSGFAIGAAILTKWLPALIVLPVWLLLVIDSGKFRPKTIIYNFLLVLVSLAVVALPWQVYIFDVFPIEAAYENEYNNIHVYKAVEGHGGDFFYYFGRLMTDYGELILLPIAWFLWRSLKPKYFNFKVAAVLIWLVVPFAFFTFVKTKMPAYILICAPVLFFMTAEFIIFLMNQYHRKYLKVIYTITLILLIALPARYTIERTKALKNTDRSPDWVSDLKHFDTQSTDKTILFNYSCPVEAMFYTDIAAAYPFIPETGKLLELREKGYTIVINQKDNVDPQVVITHGFKTVSLQER